MEVAAETREEAGEAAMKVLQDTDAPAKYRHAGSDRDLAAAYQANRFPKVTRQVGDHLPLAVFSQCVN